MNKQEIKEIKEMLQKCKGVWHEGKCISDFAYYDGINKFGVTFQIGTSLHYELKKEELSIDNVMLLCNEILNNTAPVKHTTQNINVVEPIHEEKFKNERSILFDTMMKLQRGEIDKDVAREISNTAQTIINSVKVELDFIKVINKMN